MSGREVKETSVSLCHRCEHRAHALETGHGPRCECTTFGMSVCGCYMYRPVNPVVLKRRKGDRRAVGLQPMLGPRLEAVGVYDELVPVLRKLGRGKWVIVLEDRT